MVTFCILSAVKGNAYVHVLVEEGAFFSNHSMDEAFYSGWNLNSSLGSLV